MKELLDIVTEAFEDQFEPMSPEDITKEIKSLKGRKLHNKFEDYLIEMLSDNLAIDDLMILLHETTGEDWGQKIVEVLLENTHEDFMIDAILNKWTIAHLAGAAQMRHGHR